MSMDLAFFGRMTRHISRGLVDAPKRFIVGELKPRCSSSDLISFSAISVGILLITTLRLRSSVRRNDWNVTFRLRRVFWIFQNMVNIVCG